MIKFIIFYVFILLTIFNSLSGTEFVNYNYNPTYKFKDDFVINHLSKLDYNNIICAGQELVDPSLPPSRIINNIILQSNDGGNTWKKIYSDSNETKEFSDRFNPNIKELKYHNKDNITMIHHNGYITKTTNGGQSWTLDTLGFTFDLREIEYYNPETSIAIFKVSINKKIEYKVFLTEDSWNNWTELEIPFDTIFNANYRLIGIPYYDSKKLYFNVSYGEAVNDSVTNVFTSLLKYNHNQNTWEKQFVSLAKNQQNGKFDFSNIFYRSFDFTDSSTGFAFAYTLSEVKSDNAGNPWVYPMLMRTLDGGKSWETLFHDKDTLNRSRVPSKIISKFGDDLVFTNSDRSLLFLLEPNAEKFKTVFSNNISDIILNYSYKGTKDFLFIGKNKMLITGGSNYLFEIDLSNPITSIEQEDFVSDILIYPNPLPKGKELNIKFTPKSTGKAEIRIIGIDGREYYHFNELFKDNSAEITLNKNVDLRTGIYIMEIKYSNGQSNSSSFVVE